MVTHTVTQLQTAGTIISGLPSVGMDNKAE